MILNFSLNVQGVADYATRLGNGDGSRAQEILDFAGRALGSSDFWIAGALGFETTIARCLKCGTKTPAKRVRIFGRGTRAARRSISSSGDIEITVLPSV